MNNIINLDVHLKVSKINLESGNIYVVLKDRYSDSTFTLYLPEEVARSVEIGEAFFLVSSDRRVPNKGDMRHQGERLEMFNGDEWKTVDHPSNRSTVNA